MASEMLNHDSEGGVEISSILTRVHRVGFQAGRVVAAKGFGHDKVPKVG